MRLNGRVKGYDLEGEYAVIQYEVDEGRELSNRNKRVNILSVFRGTNLVSTFQITPKFSEGSRGEPSSHLRHSPGSSESRIMAHGRG